MNAGVGLGQSSDAILTTPARVVHKRPRPDESSNDSGGGGASCGGGASFAGGASSLGGGGVSTWCVRYDPASDAARLGVRDGAAALVAAQGVKDADAAAELICWTLREEQDVCVRRAVEAVGVEAAMALLVAAVETETAGGLATAETAPGVPRRRTPGGVFFALLKDVASKEQYKAIFAARDKDHQRRMNATKKADGRNRCTKARMSLDG